MRVVAGQARGRVLKAVPGMNTRPTTDKVKEAIFSMIGPYFEGGAALDLFAGTGGLGIEAWSRGIQRIILVDREKLSIDTIRHNLKTAGAEQSAEIYRNDAERALKALAKRGLSFRLVFLDPPYRMTNMDEMMSGMAEAGMLEPGAFVVIEHDTAVVYPDEDVEFRCLRKARYGDTSVTIYQYIGNDSKDRREADDNNE